MANFFELLGFDSNDMADAMPEKIVQAFHDKGKDGVRVLMYEEMAKRLQCPLYIHIGHEDGSTSHQPDVYGSDMPGDPIRLIREPTDLYRKYGESGGGSSPNRDSPEAPVARKRAGGGGGGGGGGKNTGPDAWEKRFADLADFVAKNGFRPRRTAPTDAERHLHYWMGQQQRKLGHNELPRDQADKLEALLQATKGKKADSARKGGGGGSSRSRGASQADGDDGGDDGGYGDDGDD